MLAEFRDGSPSHVTTPVTAAPQWTEAEVAERMSGNLCRCGAYDGIVAAIHRTGASE
ncbi:aerobic-type carbon monoxide dehydrogenase small subunit (CoxS/CutS family) [Amycolatopsis umgeniensis]|uniref:Aerobic-type carbon monoxide dehydrogenase small subunit (CoxS/CutS family) n=1 Tax=Amycolatopsis umgeniensis TaxID=336628 RepID=A0A841ARA5_9PSEU|nr:aerobic-type carbon monoxide dehydrogenase small subunit (CoxS/CutS family) [Amycolatopsis umgeniensis]